MNPLGPIIVTSIICVSVVVTVLVLTLRRVVYRLLDKIESDDFNGK